MHSGRVLGIVVVYLIAVVGVAPLLAAAIIVRRQAIAPLAAVAAGLMLIGWISVEMVVLAGSDCGGRAATGTPGGRSVESVHRSTTFHWVGDGFHVSTYFPSAKLPAERVSPFVLMNYGPGKDFAPCAIATVPLTCLSSLSSASIV